MTENSVLLTSQAASNFTYPTSQSQVQLAVRMCIYIYIYILSFFSIQRSYGTLKQNLLKFLTTLKSLTKMLNHLDHIIWQINCANLYSFGRAIQDVAVPKENGSFHKDLLSFFAEFRKKSVGSVLFSRDGRVITNILLFSALLKCPKGELYFPLKNIYLYNL